MTPEQWERAKEIFDVALDLAPDQRAAYVRSACSNDPTAFSEVESLLAAHEELLATQKEVDGSFLRPNWFGPAPPPAPSLRNGEVISGRFRIVRWLGKGGMGEVYEAHDSELGVQVALKTLHPEIAANPEVLNRFRQEVRIAHRITHSNVCRTFHLGRDIAHVSSDGSGTVDLTFITMEVLDGENLQQLLRGTGRIPLDRAHAIAIQMAEAIEASHLAGIIHRDIKPGNVMICPGRNGERDRVAVTDFGLAKVDTSAPGSDPELSAISHPGNIVGTPAYMAPEQLDLRPVSPATDIYAFGLVLYEMVTGQKAFPDSNTVDEARSRLVEEPPSPRAVVPTLPAEWERAILCCLQIDPADRLQHVTDVIAVLEGANPVELRKSAISRHSTRGKRLAPQHQPKTRRRRIVAIVVAVLLCVSLSWPAYRLYQSRANATVAPGTLVYLAPVKNETGEKQLDNVTELVRAGLQQSAHINLLDAGRVAAILQSMTKPPDAEIDETTAREIALRSGASRVILMRLVRSNGTYTLHVDMQQPDTNSPSRPRAHWEDEFSWPRSAQEGDLFSAHMISSLRNASDWARIKVGESNKDILSLNESPEDATTNRWDALSAFTQAERLDSQHKKWEAVLSLQNAVRFDPHFALAFARLGDILFSVNRDDEGVAAYRHALEASTERTLPRKELDRVQGMYAIDTFDYATAIGAFRDYEAFYPHDYIGWAYPTAALRALNLDEQAVVNLRKAVALEPNNSFPVLALANELIVTGHIGELSYWVNELRSRGFEAAAMQLEAQRRFLIFDFDGAYAELDRLRVSDDLSRKTRSFRTRLRIAAELGDIRRALEFANEAIRDTDQQGEKASKALSFEDRAALECQQQDYAPCLADISEAISLDPGRLVLLEAEDILGPALQLAPSGKAPVLRRAIHDVERIVDSTDFGFVTRVMRSRAHAESLLADRDITHALIEMRKAAALDAPSGSREYLGRTLLVAAEMSGLGQNAHALLTEAQTAYAAAALRPQAMWTDAWDLTPAFLTEEISAYLHITAQLGNADSATASALDFYSHLRPHSSEASKEFRQLLLRVA